MPGESLTDWAVWTVAATGWTVTEATAPRPAFAADTPMSQVMPDTGNGGTDGEVFPKKYHDETSTRPAQDTMNRMMAQGNLTDLIHRVASGKERITLNGEGDEMIASYASWSASERMVGRRSSNCGRAVCVVSQTTSRLMSK